jgi:hypothetical protein
MKITSNTQVQYSNSTLKTQNEEKVTENKQSNRYEMLLNMSYDNMTEAERSELSHYNAMRPMSFLDEAGNEALNKALEGKTDAEKFSIKNMLQLEFMTSIKVNHSNHTVDREKFDSIDTSKSATVNRFEKFMEDFHKNGTVDNIGLMNVMDKFLNIYKASDPSTDIKNQEDSVVDKFLENLYSKESLSVASSITKGKIETSVKEFHQILKEEFGNSLEVQSKIKTKLNEFKQKLLEELKTNLTDENSNISILEKHSIVKVLLDESNNTKSSSLETLSQILKATSSS